MTESTGILDEVGPLVDEWLGLNFAAKTKPLYQHKTAALELSKRVSIPSATKFLIAAYEQIDKNLKKSTYRRQRPPSRENWRFCPHPNTSEDNESPEVTLERAIIRADSAHWSNQVPTSSGLTGPYRDKVRNVDLVHRDDHNNVTLIELKVGSNTPLFAAIEILQYGLLLAWSRNNAEELGYTPSDQPLLFPRALGLCVLAPPDYYHSDDRLDLTLLSQSINQGLRELRGKFGLSILFEFTQFRDSFNPGDTPQNLLVQAEHRTPVVW